MLRYAHLQPPWTALLLTVVLLVLVLGVLMMHRVNELVPAPRWRMRELPLERRGRGTNMSVLSPEFMDLDGGAMPTAHPPTQAASATSTRSVAAAAAAVANCASSPRGRWVPTDGHEYARRGEERAKLYPDLCYLSVSNHRRFECQPDDLGLQWESDCLEGVNVEAFLERYANKTLSFVGDSMVRQLFFRFACHFARHAVAVDTRNPRGLESPLYSVTLRGNVTLLNQWFGLRPTIRFNKTILQGDVYIFSAGAFAKSWAELEFGLLHWHRVLSGPGHQLLYLEYAAPHFPSASSDYENLTVALNLSKLHESQRACKPLEHGAFASSRSGFRLRQANALMERLNVTILHAFDITAPAFRQHNMRVWGVQMDCRHYCEPSPAMDAQVQVFHNLLMENGTTP